MSDIADDAQKPIEINTNLAISKIKVSTGKSLDYCEDCEEAIPKARKDIGGITHCIECQSFIEAKARSGN